MSDGLWLWKNFVDGKPEYWAFDNPFPIHFDSDDPQTLGQPCGYAVYKPSRRGRPDVSDEQALARIKSDSVGEIERLRARVAKLEAEVAEAKLGDGAIASDNTLFRGNSVAHWWNKAQAREAAQVWRPIESAPRDGSEINVWCPSDNPEDDGGYVVSGAWWGSVLSYDDEGREIALYCWRCHGDEGIRWAHQPTHWLPLPAPPKVAK